MTSVSLPRLALRGNAGQFALLVAPEQLPWARTTLTDGRPDPDLRPSGRQFLPVAGRVPPGLALLASSRLTVQLHPVTYLVLVGFDPQPHRDARIEQRSWSCAM